MNTLVGHCAVSCLVASGVKSAAPIVVFGYFGPGGVGALGLLVVVALVLVIGAVGLVLHPIRLILRHRRRLREGESEDSRGSVSSQPPVPGSH